MENLNRRRFLQVSVAAGAAGLVPGIPAAPAATVGKPFRLGIIIGVSKDPEAASSVSRNLVFCIRRAPMTS